MSAYPYVWRWKTQACPWFPGERRRHPLADRVGQRLRIVVRGTMNSALVEFEDGYRTITSRNALRRA